VKHAIVCQIAFGGILQSKSSKGELCVNGYIIAYSRGVRLIRPHPENPVRSTRTGDCM